MSPTIDNLSEAEIVRRLAEARELSSGQPHSEFPYPSELLPGPARPAAVLIPLLRSEGVWHILYTRRNAALAEHSGQVAFPGGRMEAGEPDPESTALREAREEIGLNPANVRILGRLNDFVTITNYQVTPVVGAIPWPFPIRLAPDEVSRVFTIPLKWLADPANREERLRSLPVPYPPVTVIYFQPYENEILWGASARFTLALLRILLPDKS